MELPVINYNGQRTDRTVQLTDDLVGQEPNEHAIYLDVKRIQASKRQGTHKTKERSDLMGSGTKMRRQKGTGFARVGDNKSPIFRGGATVFGPQPRDHSIKVNKKVQRLARRSAFAAKLKANQVHIIEDLQMEAPRTKDFQNFINNLELEGTPTLLVTSKADRNLSLSVRNIPEVHEQSAKSLNTEAILRYQHVLLSESIVNELQENLK